VISGSDGRKSVGLVAVNTVAQAGTAVTVTSVEQAVSAFGSSGQEDMTGLIQLALKNGAAKVVALPVASEEDYAQAFAQMGAMEDIQVVICDSIDTDVQQALREMVEQSSKVRLERIAVVAGTAEESEQALVQRAAKLNSERVVLVGPGGADEEGQAMSGLTVAAAVAGAIAGEQDPALPLGGAVLYGLTGLAKRYDDNALDLLIQGGVTPVESVSGQTTVVRGVTTRTTTDGAADKTWRELSTILVVDDVIPDIRAALKSRFARSKNTSQTRGSIRSQVVLELENKLSKEIITGYDNVQVSADEEDPTVCLVDFSFTVSHGLNQIWLTAHISV
jgi:hypothetical protein